MRIRTRRAATVLAVIATVGVAAAPAALALGHLGEPDNQEFTTSTLRVTTTQRVDLPDAEATECGEPASEPVLVRETATVLAPVETVIVTFGPATIYIGENEQTPHQVPDGIENFNTRTTYETVITQEYQATAAGPPCAVVAAARFTG